LMGWIHRDSKPKAEIKLLPISEIQNQLQDL